MKKLSVKNGTTFGTIFMMAFLNNAFRFCPVDFLRIYDKAVEPNWFSCILGLIFAFLSLCIFNLFTKDEGTILENGKKVDLNGKKIKGNITIE